MRISTDWKQGKVQATAESTEDLWVLSTLLQPGDKVRGRTYRKIKPTEEAEAKRKPVTLTLEVKKASWSESSPVLKILGTVAEGTEDVPQGSHHSINMEVGDKITITKNWMSFQRQRLEESTQRKQNVLICVFDRSEAIIAKVARAGYDVLAEVKGQVAKKQMTEHGIKDFFKELSNKLQEYNKRLEPDVIIAASPAFWKKELEQKLTEDVKAKARFATVSGVDATSLGELLRRPETRDALHQSRIKKESEAVEEILADISKGKPVAYGLQEVEAAAKAGAISKLLVQDKLLREEIEQIEPILKAVDKQKGEIIIITGDHHPGKQLEGIGGIAAKLRYAIN